MRHNLSNTKHLVAAIMSKTIVEEEEISRDEMSLLWERGARDYLEGLKKFLETDNNTLTPITSVAMRKVIFY